MPTAGMYSNTAPHAYRQTSVMTASPAQLVVMLYDGAVKFLRQAVAAGEAGQPLAAAKPIGRAQAIIEELLATLDIEQGGQIAAQLQGLYVFSLSELASARLEQQPQRVEPVIELLLELRGSWATLAQSQG